MIEIKVYERDQLDFELKDGHSTHVNIMKEGGNILGIAAFTFTEEGMRLNYTEMYEENDSLFDGLIRATFNYAVLKYLDDIEINDESTIDYLRKNEVELVNGKVSVIDFFDRKNCE